MCSKLVAIYKILTRWCSRRHYCCNRDYIEKNTTYLGIYLEWNSLPVSSQIFVV